MPSRHAPASYYKAAPKKKVKEKSELKPEVPGARNIILAKKIHGRYRGERATFTAEYFSNEGRQFPRVQIAEIFVEATNNCQLMVARSFDHTMSYCANKNQLIALFTKIVDVGQKPLLLLDINEEIRDELAEKLGKSYEDYCMKEARYDSTSGSIMYLVLLNFEDLLQGSDDDYYDEDYY